MALAHRLKLDPMTDRLISLSAGIWLCLLFLFAWRVKLQTGTWPIYSQPDPKSVGMDIHHALLWLSAYCLFWLALARLISLRFRKLSLFWLTAALSFFGFTSLFLSGENAGMLIFAALAGHLFIAAALVVSFWVRREWNFNSVTLLATTSTFWIHAVLDPLKFISWFLD
jgi:hypothetical protein